MRGVSECAYMMNWCGHQYLRLYDDLAHVWVFAYVIIIRHMCGGYIYLSRKYIFAIESSLAIESSIVVMNNAMSDSPLAAPYTRIVVGNILAIKCRSTCVSYIID